MRAACERRARSPTDLVRRVGVRGEEELRDLEVALEDGALEGGLPVRVRRVHRRARPQQRRHDGRVAALRGPVERGRLELRTVLRLDVGAALEAHLDDAQLAALGAAQHQLRPLAQLRRRRRRHQDRWHRRVRLEPQPRAHDVEEERERCLDGRRQSRQEEALAVVVEGDAVVLAEPRLLPRRRLAAVAAARARVHDPIVVARVHAAVEAVGAHGARRVDLAVEAAVGDAAALPHRAAHALLPLATLGQLREEGRRVVGADRRGEAALQRALDGDVVAAVTE
eukprot:444002-Prymnesium_polylepis.2